MPFFAVFYDIFGILGPGPGALLQGFGVPVQTGLKVAKPVKPGLSKPGILAPYTLVYLSGKPVTSGPLENVHRYRRIRSGAGHF